jgi:hypothetical protein
LFPSPSGKQLLEASRVNDGSTQGVRTDFLALLDYQQGKVSKLLVIVGKNREMQSCGQAGRSGSNQEYVYFERLSFHEVPLLLATSVGSSIA